MKSAHVLWLALVSVVVLQFSTGVYAALYEDPCDIMSGRVDFDNYSSPTLAGFVDYAVYAPGDYSGSISFPDQYVYAYQFFNNDTSEIGIDFFSVGVLPDITVFNVLDDPLFAYGVPGGVRPSVEFALTESVLYLFQLDNVAADEHSSVLLFTSDREPMMGAGVVSGGITGGVIVELPTPAPEPVTVALLGLGAMLAARRRRR